MEHTRPHAGSVEDVLSSLRSGMAGLTMEEAAARRAADGPNELPHRETETALRRFVRQFTDPLIIILNLSCVVSIVLGEIEDGLVIFGVVLVNAIIGFVQEGKAVQALKNLASSVGSEATVVRDGVKHRIATTDVAMGDLLWLESGSKVAADVRIVWTNRLAFDESALTGESLPVEKSIDALPEETPLADRVNMAFASTNVTHGEGLGVVTAIGGATEVGAISELMQEHATLETPLTKNLARFSRIVLLGVLILACVTFMIGWINGGSLLDLLMASVALSVAAIPEGLPAAVTIILAIGVNRMARRRAIIRRLPAVETLGSTTVICSDKTGTLTQNQMTVVHLYDGHGQFAVSGGGYRPVGEITSSDDQSRPIPTDLLTTAALCTTARVVEQQGEWISLGDPTESALIVAAMKAGIDIEQLTQEYPRIDSIPFSSEDRFMATLHRDADRARSVIAMKGSVDVILSRCDTADQQRIEQHAESLSRRGLRVLAFARKDMGLDVHNIDTSAIASGMTFLGLIAMVDPPRDEAIKAVATCHAAGVDVKMITGDHAATAATIAQQIGLRGEADPADPSRLRAVTGRELQTMSDEEFNAAALRVGVFARVAPEQKLRLVQAMRAHGHVVAMTGDGVNDAPALRAADIGVAMGKGGTDVAKDAADIVLTDDNFASIVNAVEEGRTVFDNLRKFIVWTIPTNIGEGMVLVIAVIMGGALPILPVQILWINMTTAILLGLPLAFEPMHPNAMMRRPRNVRKPVFTRDLIGRTLTVSALLVMSSFVVFHSLAGDETDPLALRAAQTAAANTFVVMQMFYLFNCRTISGPVSRVGWFSNPWVWAASVTMMAFQMAFTYLPFMNEIFHTAPVPLDVWLIAIASGAVMSVVIAIEKKLRHRNVDNDQR